jgi:pantoate--beta-alanine ligase
MRRITSLTEWRQKANEIRSTGNRVALVPTMGALHAGHLALVRAAKASGATVLMTIFVNPRQFSDVNDLEKYPRDLEADAILASEAGVDVLITPDVASMWPDFPASTKTTVSVAELGDVFEGLGRTGHFDGVASVVTKLFAITGPCDAYFGEKDFQQVAVIRQLIRDLGLDITLVTVPTVREESGLALSSRNVRLSPSGKEAAKELSQLVRAVEETASLGDAEEIIASHLAASDLEWHYAAIVDAETLRAPDENTSSLRVLVAASIENVRLIDNGPVVISKG